MAQLSGGSQAVQRRTGAKLSALVDVRESTLCLCGCDFVCVMCVDVMRACLVRESRLLWRCSAVSRSCGAV